MALEYLSEWYTCLKESLSNPVSRPVPIALATTAGTLGAWLICKTWNRNRKLPPSPPGRFLSGNYYDLSEDIHLDFIRLQKENNLSDVFTLNLGWGKKIIVLNSFDAIKDAFLTQGELFAARPKKIAIGYMKLYDEIFGKDYLDPTWKDGKAFILSALRSTGFGSTKNTEEKILEQFDMLTETLDPIADSGTATDLSEVLRKTTANVLFQILFNKSYKLDDPELAERIDLVHQWYTSFGLIFNFDFYPRWLIEIFMRKSIRYLYKVTEDVRMFIRQEIKEHLETMDPQHPRDFLDIYLTKKSGPVDTEMLANTVFALMPDGIDSIGSIINWVVLFVTHHPEVMKKIQDEANNVTKGNRFVTLSDRSSMPYTEAVIMEVIRVAVPITLTETHCAIKDCYFRGYQIPKNIPIQGNLYAALTDLKHYKNPECFDPDRFLDQDGHLIKSDIWIPFGMGRRKCAGEQTTKAEVFLFVANLFLRYDFSFPADEPSPPMNPKDDIVVRSPQPFKVVLKSVG